MSRSLVNYSPSSSLATLRSCAPITLAILRSYARFSALYINFFSEALFDSQIQDPDTRPNFSDPGFPSIFDSDTYESSKEAESQQTPPETKIGQRYIRNQPLSTQRSNTTRNTISKIPETLHTSQTQPATNKATVTKGLKSSFFV